MINFEFPEDGKYFANLLAHGDMEMLEKEFSELFDFNNPDIKRKEFNRIAKKVLEDLLNKFGEVCQLKLHKDCSKVQIFESDHIIPLSSNQLNKELRGIMRHSSKKVQRQSFGSNQVQNFTLACKRCNAFKKNNFF